MFRWQRGAWRFVRNSAIHRTTLAHRKVYNFMWKFVSKSEKRRRTFHRLNDKMRLIFISRFSYGRGGNGLNYSQCYRLVFNSCQIHKISLKFASTFTPFLSTSDVVSESKYMNLTRRNQKKWISILPKYYRVEWNERTTRKICKQITEKNRHESNNCQQ